MNDFIYVLTLIENDGYLPGARLKAGRKLDAHTVGWFNTLEEAEKSLPQVIALIENYNTAVVEKMRYGLTGMDYGRWFYAYDWHTKTFSAIDEPENLRTLCNFSMG